MKLNITLSLIFDWIANFAYKLNKFMNIGNKTVLHKVNIALNSPAPFFSGENQDGKMFSLDDFRGKKLCLVFYPADMTPTCTVEVCNIQLHGRLLHAARADQLDVVGHYTLAGGRTADWLPSGAGFTTAAFDATWDAVAAAIAEPRAA